MVTDRNGLWGNIVDDALVKLQRDLNNKIQSVSNWAEILDHVSLETAYGLLLTDRRKDTTAVWKQLLIGLEEVREISVKINSYPHLRIS